jgi:glycosyltransferase involved in cell wall biosynthesis
MELSKVRMLILIDSSFLGGPERYILGYAKRISGSVKTAVATFEDGRYERSQFSQALDLGIAEALSIPCSSSYDPRQVTGLMALVRKGGFNVINSHGYRANLIGLIVSRILGIQIVATFHGWTGSDAKVRVFDRVDRAALRRMDHIVTVSEANKALLKQLGIKDGEITVVPNAVDPEQHASSFQSNQAPILRQALGFGEAERICICVGRLSPEKGQEVALKALAGVIREIPECRLVFLGGGPDEVKLRMLSQELGILDFVRFVGFQENIAEYMKLSEVMILPSHTEGLPTVVLEAFLCSSFVIATSVGGTPEVVRDQETGLLVQPNKCDQLCKAIIWSLRNEKERKRMADNAYRFVMANYIFDKHAAKLAAVLEAL